MESNDAIDRLSALAQPTRLEAFRLLVRAEPDGLAAGELARRLGAPANTLSAHLGVLSRAGLISARRHSRSIIYRAEPGQVGALADYLLRDCCQGRAELCAPAGAASCS